MRLDKTIWLLFLLMFIFTGCAQERIDTPITGKLTIYLKQQITGTLSMETLQDDALMMKNQRSTFSGENVTQLEIDNSYAQFREGDDHTYYLKFKLCLLGGQFDSQPDKCDIKYYTITKKVDAVDFKELGCPDCLEELNIVKAIDWTTETS